MIRAFQLLSLLCLRQYPNRMKTKLQIVTVAIALCTGFALAADAQDKHDHKAKATPKGGRLLEKTEPHAELVVEKDRTVTINFYNHDMKPVVPTTQSVTLIAEGKDPKVSLDFEKKGNSLVSKTRLPEGDGYNVIVLFRQSPEAKPQNFRFKLDMHMCGGCKRAEYACTCDH